MNTFQYINGNTSKTIMQRYIKIQSESRFKNRCGSCHPEPQERFFKFAVLFFLLMFFSILASAQNLNAPNKIGPLGTQVNTMSGNLFIPRTDFVLPGRGFNLDIIFYYNSYVYDKDQGFGKGWNFENNAGYELDTLDNVLFNWGDGREDFYQKLPGGVYKTPVGFYNTVIQYQPGKYLLTELDGSKYYFDDATYKRITKKEDRYGNAVNFTYTDSLLTSLQHSNGLAVTLNYNAQGHLIKVTDAVSSPNREWSYGYDAAGNLLQVTDPLGGLQKYSYLPNGPMKTLSDKNQNVVDIIYYSDYSTREVIGCNKRQSFSYDTLTQMTVVTDYNPGLQNQITTYRYKSENGISWVTSIQGNCCGYNLAFEYDAVGNKVKQTDANGNNYAFTWDNFGKMLTSTDPLGFTTTFTYTSDFHEPKTYKDGNGNIFSMTYDGFGNITQFNQPLGLLNTMQYASNGDLTQYTDARGNVFTMEYDAYGNMLKMISPLGKTEHWAYNARGNLLSTTDSRGNISTLQFDLLDRPLSGKDAKGNFIYMSYDPQGNMISYKDENGSTNSYSYDAANRLVQFKDGKNKKFYLSYDALDNMITRQDAIGNKTMYVYDLQNRLTQMTDPVGNSLKYEYDGNGNIIKAVSALGQTFTHIYDKLNRLIDAKDEGGNLISTQFDGNGNMVKQTNAVGAATSFQYDALDRLIGVTDPLGKKTVANYDNNGNLLSILDRENKIKSNTYDDLDRKIVATDEIGNTTFFAYDTEGNITSFTDEKNNTTAYEYDNLNRKSKMIYPDGKYLQPTYDNFGQITAMRLTDGQNLLYEYDSVHNLTKKIIPGSGEHNYAYDANRRLVSATNYAGNINMAYDPSGRKTSETFAGKTVAYTYDAVTRQKKTIYPDNSEVVNQYDKREMLTSIKKDGADIVDFQYGNAYILSKATYANNVSSDMQYDFANRLSNLSTGNGNIQNSSFAYNNLTMKTGIGQDNIPDSATTMSYDNAHRLIQSNKGPVVSPILNFSYQYDASGNWISAINNGNTTTYGINNLNQVQTSTAASGNINFLYDDRGNLIFDGVHYKQYDGGNRLRSDSVSPINKTLYSYDAFGRRVQKIVNGTGFNYTYSELQPIETRNFPTDTVVNTTIFSSHSSPVMFIKNNASYFYQRDEMGSVRAITNSAGVVVEKYSYGPFGQQQINNAAGYPLSTSSVGNTFGYTGKEFDEETNSLHFHYREYASDKGRFLQRDPLGYQAGSNLYAYVTNNPYNFTDPLGLDRWNGWVAETSAAAQNGTYTAQTLLETSQLMNGEELVEATQYLDKLTNGISGYGKGAKEIQKQLTRDRINYLNNLVRKNSKMLKTLGKIGTHLTTLDILYKLYTFHTYKADCPGSDDDLIQQSINTKDVLVSTLGYIGSAGLINLADYASEKAFGISATSKLTKTTFYANEFFENNKVLRHMNPLSTFNAIGEGAGHLSVYADEVLNNFNDHAAESASRNPYLYRKH